MKLIHTADLHLDSAMDSRLSGETARKRRRELLLTFSRIVELGEEEGVRAILIAGDLFDTSHPSPSSLRYVLDTVASHPGIDFLVLHGNHAGDFRFGRDVPPNLKVFGEESYTGYRYGKVTVYGCETPSAVFPAADPDACNIVMLHGQTSETGHGEDAVVLSALRSKNIDYLALGHLHGFFAENLDRRGIYCYAGCPEGRGFDEIGEKGVVILTVEDGKLSYETRVLSRRRFLTVEVDITECGSQRMIEEQVSQAIREISAEDCVRISLIGKRETAILPALSQCRTMLEGRFFYSEVRDETVFSLAPESYAHDLSLRGEFVRTVLRSNPDPAVGDLILSVGLAALDGEEVPL